MAKGRGSLKIQKKNNPTSGKNYLLVIGINDYQHFSVLNNAVRDAKTIRDLLIENYQFQAEHTISLFNEEATRDNILGELYNYQEIIKANDNFLLYFAGHGIMNPKKTQGYWIPAEADRKRAEYIENTIVLDVLRDIESHHTYLIIDSCFSGSIILRDAEKDSFLEESLPSRRVLTSGRKQVVADGPMGGHSPFANSIIQCLKNNTSKKISALDLEYHVQKNTPRNANQNPEASFIYGLGDQSGQFVFYSERTTLEPLWEDLKGNLSACQLYVCDFPEGKFLEEAYWEVASNSGGLSAYKTYARKFRRGKFITEALKKIASFDEKQAFENAKKRGWTGLMKFINKYPDSQYVEEVEAEIDKIEAEEEKESTKEKTSPSKPKVKPIAKSPFEMVLIEGGSFMMGSEDYYDEGPIHKVTLSSFEIGKYLVTQKQWEDVMGKNPSRFKDCSDCPVEMVSWNDTQKFLGKLNSRFPEMNYRLPTEAEWEYAARGGNQSWGFIYAGSNDHAEVGWYSKNSNSKTKAVGQKLVNELGIYDMSGNVWEWCFDWYDLDYYENAPGNDPKGPASGQVYVVRGGSWHHTSANLRISGRNYFYPHLRHDYIGFRLARSL